MTQHNIPNKIALLATGDEITNGDILNTNTQVIAHTLFTHGMRVGTHLTAPDNTGEITEAIHFLLSKHRALIITGGLGPTSDDLTRFALSKALDQPLSFHETTWDSICQRFKALGYPSPPENNRIQALFPEKAIIIPNSLGTAAGCMLEENGHWIFMLPGPPAECLPMVHNVVLPLLHNQHFQEVRYYEQWLVFNIGESLIAEKLDALAASFNCTIGYRLAYPYIEIKLYSNEADDFAKLLPEVKETIAPYLFFDGKETASALLQKKLLRHQRCLYIKDLATGGLLEHTLKTPENAPYLHFNSDTGIVIEGLEEFWRGETGNQTNLSIHLPNQRTLTKRIPMRGIRVKQYAVEWISQTFNELLDANEL